MALRYLYESDSIAAERLDMQIHLLEEVDRTTPTSPLKSPSKELSSTLRNLKRLENALQGKFQSFSLSGLKIVFKL